MATKEVMASDAQAVWEINRQLFSLQRLEVMDKIRDPHIDQRLVVAVHSSKKGPQTGVSLLPSASAFTKHNQPEIFRRDASPGGVDFRSTVAGPAPFASFPWPARLECFFRRSRRDILDWGPSWLSSLSPELLQT